MLFLIALLTLDIKPPVVTADEPGLPPGLYRMIDGPVDPKTFHDKAWQYHGVIVLCDDRELLAVYSASNKDNYVELIFWKEVGDHLEWRTERMLGKIVIKFENDRVEKRYKQWLRTPAANIRQGEKPF